MSAEVSATNELNGISVLPRLIGCDASQSTPTPLDQGFPTLFFCSGIFIKELVADLNAFI